MKKTELLSGGRGLVADRRSKLGDARTMQANLLAVVVLSAKLVQLAVESRANKLAAVSVVLPVGPLPRVSLRGRGSRKQGGCVLALP